MLLKFISLSKSENFDINWLEINTDSGNYVIQPGHVPMIINVKDNSQIIFSLNNKEKEQKTFVLKRGIVHIQRKEICILYN